MDYGKSFKNGQMLQLMEHLIVFGGTGSTRNGPQEPYEPSSLHMHKSLAVFADTNIDGLEISL